jgi:hypothetical protein
VPGLHARGDWSLELVIERLAARGSQTGSPGLKVRF